MNERTRPNPVPQNGAAIREIRKREGLTVSELANKILVSAPHLRNIENEFRPASTEHMARIASALNCTLASIRREAAATEQVSA